MATTTHNEYRFVVIGAGGVGKSALTVRFIQGNFLEKYDPTIEDSYLKHIEVDGIACVLDIMDTAGQEEYKALRDSYMKSGQGFVLVCSITSPSSFEKAAGLYRDIVRSKDGLQDIPVILVANKSDLEEEREVKKEDAQALAKKLGIGFIEASAKSNMNVYSAFEELVRMTNRWREKHPEQAPKRKKPVRRCILF